MMSAAFSRNAAAKHTTPSNLQASLASAGAHPCAACCRSSAPRPRPAPAAAPSRPVRCAWQGMGGGRAAWLTRKLGRLTIAGHTLCSAPGMLAAHAHARALGAGTPANTRGTHHLPHSSHCAQLSKSSWSAVWTSAPQSEQGAAAARPRLTQKPHAPQASHLKNPAGLGAEGSW